MASPVFSFERDSRYLPNVIKPITTITTSKYKYSGRERNNPKEGKKNTVLLYKYAVRVPIPTKESIFATLNLINLKSASKYGLPIQKINIEETINERVLKMVMGI